MNRNTAIVYFGLYEFDSARLELKKKGRPVRLQTQPAKALSFLLDNAGEIVTRAQLRDELWGNTHIESDAGINFCIRRIREALKDNVANPVFLQTVRGRGYRFVAPVDAALPSGTTALADHPNGHAKSWWMVASILSVLTLATIGLFTYRSSSTAVNSDPAFLAVLPFQITDASPDLAYLGYGITDEITSALAQAWPQKLAVVAQTSTESFRDSAVPLGEIIDALHADLILDGSVRINEDKVRVTARLIRGADETYLWVKRFDHPLQSVITTPSLLVGMIKESIADELGLVETLPLVQLGDLDIESRSSFLKGRYHLARQTPESLAKAVAMFEQVVDRNPDFTPGKVQLAKAVSSCPDQSYGGADRVRSLLDQAIEVTPLLAEAHLEKGNLQFFTDWNWDGARNSFETAISLNPNLVFALKGLAFYNSAVGNHDKALDFVRSAMELDPVSTNLRADLGWFYFRARRYKDARKQCLETLDLNSSDTNALRCLAEAASAAGDYNAAWTHTEALIRDSGVPPQVVESLSRIGQKNPRKALTEYSSWRLDWHRTSAIQGNPYPTTLATLLAKERNVSEAIEWLQVAYEQRDWQMPFLAIDPRLDPLRSDSRFVDLLRQMNLPVLKHSQPSLLPQRHRIGRRARSAT